VQYSLWYVVPNTWPVGDLVTEELRHQITDWPPVQSTNSVCLTVEEVAAHATGQKLPRDSPRNSDL